MPLAWIKRRPTRGMTLRFPLFLVALACSIASSAAADDIETWFGAISQAGPQGSGSAAARVASQSLAGQDTSILPRLLSAMETGNPVAANWARSAFETIVERELATSDRDFPTTTLQAFVADPRRVGRVRRLALTLCEQLDPGYTKRIVPTMLADPEFRQDAVDMALAAGQQSLEAGDSETARERFRQAFEHARDGGQVQRAAGKLTGLNEPADIVQHLGLVVDWWLVGPFDAPQTSGFAREYLPHDRVELSARFVGQESREIGWMRHRTTDSLGLVNLAQAIAPAKEAVGYAYAELTSPRDMTGQVRCGADDNCTVWLNGEKVFGREQWLNGTRFDRFVAPVQLRSGSNQLLVKICQGPQHKDPQVPNNWSLQLRLCDEEGKGLPLQVAPGDGTESKK
jgi:hypothetical protein